MASGKPLIGIAGGIGSGKSTVSTLLAELGAGVIDSDRLNREELNSPDVLEVLRGWWGDQVIDASGHADRRMIRRIIGEDSTARRRLEELVHPRIAARRRRMEEQFNADPQVRAIVIDSPLLFEAGLADQCDAIVFVDCPPAVRLARVQQARGWQKEDLERFEKIQKSLDFKRQHADYIVDNNSDIDVVRRQVSDVFSRILTGSQDLQRE